MKRLILFGWTYGTLICFTPLVFTRRKDSEQSLFRISFLLASLWVKVIARVADIQN